VWVAGAHVQFTDAVKLLAVTLDSSLSFDKHIIDVTRSCHYHIRAMRDIRPLQTLDAAKAMAVSIAGCRLDYCNSVMYGMSHVNTDKLQHVQNILARVVVEAPWTSSSLNIRRDGRVPIQRWAFERDAFERDGWLSLSEPCASSD